MTIEISTLKSQLNEELIITILEQVGCHHIRSKSNMIQAALPNGDNPTSICIRLDEFFHVDVFTRSDFQSIQYRDIITLVGYIEELSFPKALKRICNICGIEYYDNSPIKEVPQILKWLDFVESGSITEQQEFNTRPIPKDILNSFYQNPVSKWLDENVTYESQVEWKIGSDVFSERITIPIFNEIGDLIAIKGRKMDDTDIDDSKYLYLYPCSKTQVLFGLHKNYEEIIMCNECIVLEGEKAVIKMWGHGYKNCVGIGGKSVSKHQIEMLLRLNVPITLALDSDVSEEEINIIVKELKYPVPTVPIFVIQDQMNFMEDKSSPSDDMELFKILYENYKYQA